MPNIAVGTFRETNTAKQRFKEKTLRRRLTGAGVSSCGPLTPRSAEALLTRDASWTSRGKVGSLHARTKDWFQV